MNIIDIPINQIKPDKNQPRKIFNEEELKGTAETIKTQGIINPIEIDENNVIITGECRWRAAKIANLKTIPCKVIKGITKEYRLERQLVENLNRQDFKASEHVKEILTLVNYFTSVSQTIKGRKGANLPNIQGEVSKRLGISRQHLYGLLKFEREAPAELKKAVKEQKFSMSTGMEIMKAPEESRVEITKKIIEEPIMPEHRKVRELVNQIKQGPAPEPIQLERTANDVVDDILSNLHDFKYNVDELLKSNVKSQINIEDLSKSKADKIMTTCGLHMKSFMKLINTLRQRGAKPDKLILSLIRANNGKI